MSGFSILGKTKRHKIGNILGLIVLTLFLLSKCNIEQTYEHEEVVSLSSLSEKTPSLVISAIQGHRQNLEEIIRTEAPKIGMTYEQFMKVVDIELSLPTNLSESSDVLLNFSSAENDAKFKPIYRLIAKDMELHIAQQGNESINVEQETNKD
ncbi:hypothetical protein [Pleionea sp. CnH1-48]|uniref:hypothetical protein n=1 Tax=Pleionea sp. CnH1-48 TaxID=2954494 RepID=UPI0020970EDC|nr:hypothetical protein [Pleionea sp. CnH1-48]MCO7223759.1 hypothetical protein [Pleionea sp. CnH1-48]